MEKQLLGTIGITGATGFIGSHLVSHLQKNSITFVQFSGDLADISAVRKFFTENQIKTLVHLVGSFSLPFSNLLEKNVVYTQRVLEEGTKSQLKHIIYISSGAVYGNREFAKETDPLEPANLYGLSKKFGEEVIRFYPDITSTVLRFPNVYGPGAAKGVIALFLQSIQDNSSLILEGDGSQKRQFLHVADACKAIESCLYERKSAIYNIAHHRQYQLAEIIAILKKKYVFSMQKTLLKNTQSILSMNVEKAKNEIEFEAKIDLESFLLA